MDKFPWNILIIGSLTLGLAPFVPEPHLLEKLRMLFQGNLISPIDIFDLIMHGTLPLLLLLKIILPSKATDESTSTDKD
ncbi:MAG: RND transporter [Candidatus Marithrix sp.]